MSVTFASVLQSLAHLCGAVLHDGTASAGSTTTTLTDAVELAGYSDDSLNKHRFYIYAGTGAGQERVITDHTGATGVLTFPTGTAPTPSSKYIVLRTGWTMATLRTAFIQAMRDRREFYLKDKVDESLTMVVTNGIPTYSYNVPSGFMAIERIVREDTPSGSDFLTRLPDDSWYINRATTSQIVFEKAANDRLQFIQNGHKIRLVGQAYETEPTTDADSLDITTGVLLLLAASHVFQAQRSLDRGNASGYGQLASTYWQEFLAKRGTDETIINPGSKLVKQ